MNKSIVTINWNSRAEVLLWPNCKQAWTQCGECTSQILHQMKILPNWNELKIENGAEYISHLTQSISQLVFKRNYWIWETQRNTHQSYSTSETCWQSDCFTPLLLQIPLQFIFRVCRDLLFSNFKSRKWGGEC